MQRRPGSYVDTLVREMGDKDVPVKDRIFGEEHYPRPNFVQPYRYKGLLLEGFTMKNSPMWELNPVLCSNVTVRNVTIDSHGPNNDGCNPESSRDVLIENVIFPLFDEELLILRPSAKVVRSSNVGFVCADELASAKFLLYPPRSNMRTIIENFFRELIRGR